MIYFLIFLAKILENTLSTLRLIVVASGKKVFGALLQLCVALLWVCVTGAVVQNITNDPIKIIVFAIGSLVGSYLGSLIEEKLALGYNLISYETSNENNSFTNLLNHNHITYTNINTNQKKELFIIVIPRHKQKHILYLIKEYDKKAIIMSEIIKIIKPGT